MPRVLKLFASPLLDSQATRTRKSAVRSFRWATLHLLLLLCACGSDTAERTGPADASRPTPPPAEVRAPRPSPPAPHPGQAAGSALAGLQFLSPPELFPEDVLERFGKEFRTNVQVQPLDGTNDVQGIVLDTSRPSPDVILADHLTIAALRRAGALAPIERAGLMHWTYVDPRYCGLPFDAGNTVSVPLLWETLGWCYDKRFFDGPPQTWADLFDAGRRARFRDRLALSSDPREAFAGALLFLKFSPNSADPGELEAAAGLLQAARRDGARFISGNRAQRVVMGQSVLAMGWSSEFSWPVAQHPEIAFALPDDTTLLRLRCLAIPARARDRAAAARWIDYLLRPEVAARVAEHNRIGSTNARAHELVDVSVVRGAGFARPAGLRMLLLDPASPAVVAGVAGWWKSVTGEE